MQSISYKDSSSSSSHSPKPEGKSSPILIRANNFPNKNGHMSFAESAFVTTIITSNQQYDLAQIPTDPFHLSPPNLFMEKLQKRIDKYYSRDNGENCFSFTTRA
tara:strand:+ start:492 stop:803 length:312 start_codon:yes stop_codon:yes gene_type:complete